VHQRDVARLDDLLDIEVEGSFRGRITPVADALYPARLTLTFHHNYNYESWEKDADFRSKSSYTLYCIVACPTLGETTLANRFSDSRVGCVLAAEHMNERQSQTEQEKRETCMNHTTERALSKVPEVTLIFWIIKIAATTLGETGGDAVSMSMNLGYLVATAIFAAIFLVAVVAQIKAKDFHPFLYWATIIATTTVGTTLADFADRSLGIGYAGGTSLLFALLIASLAIWYRSLGTISVDTVSSPKAEMFYWMTIMFSQTLGTALGDWTADTAGVGYAGGAMVFSTLLALIVAAYYWTTLSRTLLFWGAFILTRPLGAVVGDFLDKPLSAGGLELSRYSASAVLLAFMLANILIFRQRAAERAH
jgi:uncharacterized membrane-anchored protein